MPLDEQKLRQLTAHASFCSARYAAIRIPDASDEEWEAKMAQADEARLAVFTAVTPLLMYLEEYFGIVTGMREQK